MKKKDIPGEILGWRRVSGKAPTLRMLVRLCHTLGCEVIVKQVGLDDNGSTETMVVSL